MTDPTWLEEIDLARGPQDPDDDPAPVRRRCPCCAGRLCCYEDATYCPDCTSFTTTEQE